MKINRNIALIEDDVAIRESVQDALESEDYIVQAFKNGDDAIQNMGKGPAPALILLDLMMPVMDGWQFMEARKNLPAELSTVPVFIMSAVINPDKFKDVGATGYIRKPMDLNALLQLVESYCKP